MNNKLLLAGAGTGKTTYLIELAFATKERILIMTYTIKCKKEIENKIIKKKGYIPKNIVIQTWFSFLLEHGILPYKKDLNINYSIKGINFVDYKSGLIRINNGKPYYYGEKNFKKYYFDNNNRIYTDKISKLVIRINEANKGLVFDRISKIFSKIFIDEVQDLAGYDLEIIKKIAESTTKLVIVGDPRQSIYSTHKTTKNDKYNSGKIDKFIREECKKNSFEIDIDSLNKCRRCHKDIVKFLNDFYPEYRSLEFSEIPENDFQGIYVVRNEDLDMYLHRFNPIQLRYNKNTHVNNEYQCINYKNSKGCTFNRTIIYPTEDFKNYLKTKKTITSIGTKNAIYVALSRAVDSVAIVYDGELHQSHNIKIWKF